MMIKDPSRRRGRRGGRRLTQGCGRDGGRIWRLVCRRGKLGRLREVGIGGGRGVHDIRTLHFVDDLVAGLARSLH